jgi:hypothetical protein
MIIPKEQISIQKTIGKSSKGKIVYTKSRGGLHLISDHKGAVIAMASHPAVSRYMAEKQDPDITWTELSKSEHYTYDDFKHLIPEAIELTARAKALQSI